MTNWTADFTNDPERDFDLYVELMEDDEFKAKLYYNDMNKICLYFYGGVETTVPFEWLTGVVDALRKATELKQSLPAPTENEPSSLRHQSGV